MFFNHVLYEDILQGISTLAELAILYFVWKEGRKVVTSVNEIREATTGTVYGTTDDLNVGDRVHVLESRPGWPREKWEWSSMLYVIREVDRIRNKALATPVLSPPQGPTPTVEGPLRGEQSPFRKASVAG